MIFLNIVGKLALFAASALIVVGCGGSGGSGGSNPFTEPPTVSSTFPTTDATAIPTSSIITATFSKSMDASSLTSNSFYATSPTGRLTGTVTYSSNTAALHLASPMPTSTRISATVTTTAKDTQGNPLHVAYSWSFTTGTSADTTPPTILAIDPNAAAVGVPTNHSVSITFSKGMNSATINPTTVMLQRADASVVAATLSYANQVAVLNPSNALAANAVYTATVTPGVRDLSGNQLAFTKVWTFTTGAGPDSTSPSVMAVDPLPGATGVALNKSVSVTFSKPMNSSTLNGSTMAIYRPDGTVFPSSISYSANIATVLPSANLNSNTVYSVKVTPGARDLAGNQLVTEKDWSFTTANVVDSNPPTVFSTKPANLQTNVFLNQSINATFSKAMQASSINVTTFSVTGVVGSVSYDSVNHIASFVPSTDLLPNTTYTANIETGVTDLSGNHLAVRLTWSFTTGIQRMQTPINLGSASTYAILAGSTVTNGGPTIINGDLGVSPGTAVTGFPPGIVNGAMHRGDSVAAQAKVDLLKGQLDAAGLLGGATLPGDLSGLTFTPGLYKNNSSVMLSSGNVTLDAQGDPNAVFVFQMATTLTTSTGTQVVLAGGAKASNIYWSVGSSATLGVNSIFQGVVLAQISITVNNGATHNGTLLTNIGAVTLQANTVTRLLKK